MSGTFFPLAALANFEVSPFDLSNESAGTGHGPKVAAPGVMEDLSFSDVFQRQTSPLSAPVFFTDHRPALQAQRGLELNNPFLVPESVRVLEQGKFEKAVPPIVDMLTLLDVPSFQPVEEHEVPLDFEGREFREDLLPPFVTRDPHDQVEEPEFTNQSAVSVSALYFPSPLFELRSYSGGNLSNRDVLNVEDTPARVITPPVAPTSANGQENRQQTLSIQAIPPGKVQESLVSDKLTESVFFAPQGSESLSEASRESQGRVRIPDFLVTPLVQENGGPILRRSIIVHDELPHPATAKNPAHSLRPLVTPDAQAQPQTIEIPDVSPLRVVPGGYGPRVEGGGGVAGGTTFSMNEGIPEASWTKMNLIKIQGDMERQGMDHDGKSESGSQSGLGGFSQSPSGQQQSLPQSGQTGGGVRVLDEAVSERPTQPLQRLQLDVQVSETQRVQIDVGVQHRQVYAGLVMDQMALRNLAMQFVPQLEEQLSQLNLELNQFSAETSEEQRSEGGSSFPHNRSEPDGFKETEGSFPARTPSLSRPLTSKETGLHFVA